MYLKDLSNISVKKIKLSNNSTSQDLNSSKLHIISFVLFTYNLLKNFFSSMVIN